jgi:hypothetical protein
MATYERWIKKKVLITARTYPVPSRKAIEVSCTAGVTEDDKWIRLFPVPYRFLDQDKRFRKYQYIEANVTKAASDTRPESHKIDIESINILPDSIPSDNRWERRKAKVFPLKSDSLCCLQSERDLIGYPTLGFFKPRTISSFKIESCNSKWKESEITSLRQYPMFGNMPKTELQKLPYDFSYNFKCDNPNCKGHELKCTDWEMGASYWSWKRKYHGNWENKFRDRYETDMILRNDTHFFVGTLSTHPSEWIIIGLFYPPK